MKARALAFVALLLVSGCETTPNVSTDHDAAFDFSNLRTYTWVYTAPPQGMNPLQYQRVRASIDRALQQRSFTQGSPGDFAVAFTLGARDRVEVSDFGPYGPGFRPWGWGGGWARQVDVRNVTDGTLVIDMYDVRTRQPIWHGVATQQISGNVSQEQIDRAVDTMLAQFPPTPAR